MKPLRPFEQNYSGQNLVEASAGTGKTYNIVWLYLRFLLKEGLTVGEILVVTYTKAATKELKERLMSRIQEAIRVLKRGYDGPDSILRALDSARWLQRDEGIEKLEEALRTFDRAAVFTIHGFCKNVLEEMSFESRTSFDAELISDDTGVMQELVDDYWRRLVDEAGADGGKTILLQYLIDRNLTPDSLVDCLGPWTGKPYISIIPEEIEWGEIESHFASVQKAYRELREIWREEREGIIALLDPAVMSGYTEKNLPGRIKAVDELLLNKTSSIIDPDKRTAFKYCTQSYISENLLKKARQEGIPPPNHRFFELMDEYGKLCRFLKQTKSVFLRELLRYLQEELPERKRELEVLGYDDLLLNLYRAVREPGSGERFSALLREKYPVALVDEFQDTDPVQYDIFGSIYGGTSASLFMIGDPKQAIYSFRGADIFAYLQARRDTGGEQRFGLSENYRSVPGLLKGINSLFGGRDPFLMGDRDIPYRPVKPGHPEQAYDRLTVDAAAAGPLQFITLKPGDGSGSPKNDPTRETAEAAAADINDLLLKGGSGRAKIGGKPVTAGDIAVLVRSHNQADLMGEVLASHGIKSVQLSRESVFHTREARELEQVLAAIAEPGSERLIRGALITSLIGKTANDLYRFEEDEEQWVRQAERFAERHHAWQQHGFAYMFRSLVGEEGIARNLMSNRRGERRLTNILHLGELLQRREEEEQAGMRSLIKWMARKRTEEKNGREEEQLRLESDEDLVKIVTMHSSKGLEYPVVFCPFLWKGLTVENSGDPFLFHMRENGDACLDLTPKNRGERTERLLTRYEEELAESMRLAYVTVTRAKQQCNLYWYPFTGNRGESKFSPLGYLLLGRESVMEQMRNKLKLSDAARDITGDIFGEVVEDLKRDTGDSITFREWSAEGHGGAKTGRDRQETLQAREFGRGDILIPSRRISSFSSLAIAGEGEAEIPDYDQFVIPGTTSVRRPPETGGMSGFPRGPRPGTCVHRILEQLNFSDLSNMENVIAEQLETHGIDPDWKKTLEKNLRTVINKQLIPEVQDARLAGLPQADFVHEMEFYFDMKAVSNARIMRIIRENGSREPGGASSGFMKGYIDLTVRFGERFYIIDYKTNHLGDGPEEYSGEGMREEIREAFYDLQYHIYTVAVHRYLKKRLTGYSYEDHFGGVLYLFIRGISEDSGDCRGIYFDRPDFGTVEALDRYLKTGGGQ